MPDITGGAPAPSGAPAAAPAPAAPAPAPGAPAAPAPAAGSVLGSGATPPPPPAPGAPAQAPGTPEPPPADPLSAVPEKHRVLGTDGKLDVQATLLKVAEAYGHAEKRIGSGDVVPKSADDYKVNIPTALAEKVKAEDIAADPKMKDFLTKAHAEGLTQKQVDFMVGEHLQRSIELQGALQVLTAQECTAELRKTWQTDADYTAGVQRAYRAAEAYAGDDLEGFMKTYGNDPRIVGLLAAVGAELAEDRPAPGGAGGVTAAATLEALTKSKAYMDPNDPAHLQTKQQVERLMQQMHGTGAKRPGPIVISL